MAQFTKNQINAKIDTDLADNSLKAISAQDVRDIVKDYITASTYAPIMIYSGILKHDEGAGTAERSIQELYYNPDFFAKQLTTNPTNAYNIYKLSTVVVAANNNTYTVAPSGGNGQNLKLSIVVASNQVSSMTVTEPGSGYKVGNVLTFTVGATNLSVTYQGAARAGSSDELFALTTNTDNLYPDHKPNNTIVSGTPVDYNQGTNTSIYRDVKISANNVLRSRLDLGNSYSGHYQHIQLYRIAEHS